MDAALLATVTTLVFLVLVVAIIVAIARLVVRGLGRRDPAMDALRGRFGRGEIDEAEYERVRTTLQRG